MIISHDPTEGLTREKYHHRVILDKIFLLVTPLNAKVGSSLISLMTIDKGLSIIVSPFQNKSGCTNGQTLTQPRALVRISLQLYLPSTWARYKILAVILSQTLWFIESRLRNSRGNNYTTIISKCPRSTINWYSLHTKSIAEINNLLTSMKCNH
jgi:hypothetical protein